MPRILVSNHFKMNKKIDFLLSNQQNHLKIGNKLIIITLLHINQILKYLNILVSLLTKSVHSANAFLSSFHCDLISIQNSLNILEHMDASRAQLAYANTSYLPRQINILFKNVAALNCFRRHTVLLPPIYLPVVLLFFH